MSPLIGVEFHVDGCGVGADLGVLTPQLATDEPPPERAVLVDDEDVTIEANDPKAPPITATNSPSSMNPAQASDTISAESNEAADRLFDLPEF